MQLPASLRLVVPKSRDLTLLLLKNGVCERLLNMNIPAGWVLQEVAKSVTVRASRSTMNRPPLALAIGRHTA